MRTLLLAILLTVTATAQDTAPDPAAVRHEEIKELLEKNRQASLWLLGALLAAIAARNIKPV